MAKKERHIHEEVMQLSHNTAKNVETICNASAVSPNDISDTRQHVLETFAEEYKQNNNGDLAPVRKKRNRSRIWNRHIWKRSLH